MNMHVGESDKDQERGVHAVRAIILSHSECSDVVLLWPSSQRLLHSGKNHNFMEHKKLKKVSNNNIDLDEAATERGRVRVRYNSDDPVHDIQECEEKHPNKRRAKATASPTVRTNNGRRKTWDYGLH